MLWLYDQLQRERQMEPRFTHRRHLADGHPRKKENENETQERNQQRGSGQGHAQENEAQSSFLCGHLSVLFGLLMMGSLGLVNRELILGSDAGLSRSPSRPTSRLEVPKRELKGRREKAVDNEDGADSLMKTTNLRLDKLVDQAREFGAFYTVVSRRMTVMGDGRRGSGGVALPVGGDEVGGEEGGTRVVKDVVEFLEGLRDGI